MTKVDAGFRMRTASNTYLMAAVLLGGGLSLAVLSNLNTPWVSASRTVWEGLALFAAVLVAAIVYYACIEVSVSQGTLSYRYLLGRQSRLLADVAHSQLVQWRQGQQLLVITPTNGGKPIEFIIDDFRIDEIERLLAIPELNFRERDDVA